MSGEAPSYVVFDSGLGGLSIVRAIRRLGLGGQLVYVADHAGFPYGGRSADDVVGRVRGVVGAAIARCGDPPLRAVVIACNTASTLALPELRATWDIPFVGTVPAVKPAAAATRSGLFSVLATPETVRRDYTRALIEQFAAHREVTLVGAARLAGLAETIARGEGDAAAACDAVAAEIAPAFVALDGARTDVVVLGCTHFPLIQPELEAAAPWPVTWIDPSDAIARRLAAVAPELVGAAPRPGVVWSTAPPEPTPGLVGLLEGAGLRTDIERLQHA